MRHAHCADEQHLDELDLQLLVDIVNERISLLDNLLLDELVQLLEQPLPEVGLADHVLDVKVFFVPGVGQQNFT